MKLAKRWVLYDYKGHELVILSKSFKTKVLAEKARSKFSDSKRGKIGIGRSLLQMTDKTLAERVQRECFKRDSLRKYHRASLADENGRHDSKAATGRPVPYLQCRRR